MSELEKTAFGTLSSGEAVTLYRFRNSNGFEVAITNFGGRVVSLQAPDREGRTADVVLGFDDLSGYLLKNPYFGALVGRYANRIAGGRFVLDGETYKLPLNNPPNTLHGGVKGFDSVLWTGTEIQLEGRPALQLQYSSQDGEEGFPGTLDVKVIYSVSDQNELRIDFQATADKRTVLNLTNHSYFDLSGAGNGNVLDHMATIPSDRYLPVDENLIPTGELAPVDETPFDFRKPKRIGEQIDDKNEQLKLAIGYDHTFAVEHGADRTPSLAAHVHHPASGRTLEVYTSEPGVQFYTGNHLDGSVRGKKGAVYGFRTGFCLETQHFPNSPNQPDFPTTELMPGDQFTSSTIYRFSVDNDQ